MAGRQDTRSVAFHGRLLDDSEMARMFFNEFCQFWTFMNRNGSVFFALLRQQQQDWWTYTKPNRKSTKKI